MKHFVCETCGYVPLRAKNECDNPACLANPHSNHEKIRERIAEYEKRKRGRFVMAYVSKETKAAVVAALKATGAKKEGFSWTVGVRDHMDLTVKIRQLPVWFKVKNDEIAVDMTREYGIEINPYHPHLYFDLDDPDQKRSHDWIVKFLAAMNTGNWDKSDPMTDYFNVGWYVSLKIILK